MKRRIRRASWVLVVLAALGVVGVLLLRTQAVQRLLWSRAVETVEAESGWRITADSVKLHVLPAGLDLSELRIGRAGADSVLQADHVALRWRWRNLLWVPRRIDKVVVTGLVWESGELTPVGSTGDTTGAWSGPPTEIEIARLELRGPGGEVPSPEVIVHLSQVKLLGRMIAGQADGEIGCSLSLERSGRKLDLGRLSAQLAVSGSGLGIRRLELGGTALELEASGSLSPPWGSAAGALEVESTVPVGRLLAFWDPDLASRVRAIGRLRFSGTLGLVGGAPRPDLTGTGEGLRVAGLGVDRVRLRPAASGFNVTVASSDWGELELEGAPGGPVDIKADIERLPLRLAEAWVPSPAPRLPRPVILNGTARIHFDPAAVRESLAGLVDAEARWETGAIRLKATADRGVVEVERLEATVPESRVAIDGSVGETVALEVEAEVGSPGRLAEELERWGLTRSFDMPEGSAELTGTVRGDWNRPAVEGRLAWTGATWRGVKLGELTAVVKGDLDALSTTITASLEDAALTSTGTVRPIDRRAEMTWRLIVPDVEALATASGASVPVEGAASAHGRVEVGPNDWSAEVVAGLDKGVVQGISVRSARAELSLSQDTLKVRRFDVQLVSGSIAASGSIEGLDPDSPFSLQLRAQGLRPDVLLPSAELPLHGFLGADVNLEGTVGRPKGVGWLSWTADQETALLGSSRIDFSLESGRLFLHSTGIETAAGRLAATAELPLGALPLPGWLSAGAPAGPARVRLGGCGLEAVPLLNAAGLEGLPLAGSTDLEADLEIDPSSPERLSAQVTCSGLRLVTPAGPVVAQGPVLVQAGEGRLKLEPTRLGGSGTEIEIEGGLDLAGQSLDASVRGVFAPELIQLAMPMVRVEGPMAVSASATGPIDAPTGRLEVRHRQGRLFLSDPPVEVQNLSLDATFKGGVLEVDNGSAEVNGGHLELGGGWDPQSGQGVVAELDDVSALVPPGIVTRWNGLVAVEPGSEGRLRVVGDLELVEGVWDTPFDLFSVLSETGVAPIGVDDPLEGIDLEMEVAGRSGILIDNNLGRFQVLWRRLDVGGTLARPVVSGELQLLPGGTLQVGARTLSIVKGSVELPPVLGAEPVLEVLVRDPAASGGGLRSLAMADLVQAGAVAGVGRVFGVEATTIEPVEVAAETETDPAGRLTLGRRLGPHLSYFFSTSISNVQDQAQVVQVGDWGSLPGLYAQWFRSAGEEDGWAVLERLRWGGSRGEAETGEQLKKVELEGRWPVAKWKLKRALGMTRGQRWQPFMAFAAAVRLERELAGRGFPEARVGAEVGGAPDGRILTLRCDPGRPLEVRWEGDRVPGVVRRRLMAAYSPFVPAATSRRALHQALVREMAVLGFPEASVSVSGGMNDGLTVRVERGRRMELDRLELMGLPRDIATEVARWWSSRADRAALLQGADSARSRLLRLLAAEGYPDAVVSEIREARRKGKTDGVEVLVQPGVRTTVSSVHLEGEDPLGLLGRGDSAVREGAPLRRSTLRVVKRQLLHAYREAGYSEARVNVTAGNRLDPGQVRVELDPGPRRVVSEVHFKGLRHLREKVLEHGVELRPGEPLRESAVDATLVALSGFPPIEEVRIETSPAAGEGSRVTIAVKEKPRWTAGLGSRWSSDRGQQILFELDDEDLLGRGVSARLRARWGSRDRSAQVLLGVPPPPGGIVHFALSGAATHTERGDQIERVVQATLEGWVERGVGNQFRLFLQHRRTHVFETNPNEFFPFDVTLDLPSVGGEVILDRRDDPLDPRRGWLFSLSAAYSPSFLGADLPAVRTAVNFSWAAEPRSGWTLAQGVRVGAARALEGNLDSSQRFYAGGETSVRGFDRDWVGSETCFLGECHPAGGGALLVLNQELRRRLTSDLIGVAFIDAGGVWESWSDAGSDLSVGVGAGLRVATPLGPLRLDLAVPVARKGRSSGLHAYLGIGQVF